MVQQWYQVQINTNLTLIIWTHLSGMTITSKCMPAYPVDVQSQVAEAVVVALQAYSDSLPYTTQYTATYQQQFQFTSSPHLTPELYKLFLLTYLLHATASLSLPITSVLVIYLQYSINTCHFKIYNKFGFFLHKTTLQ